MAQHKHVGFRFTVTLLCCFLTSAVATLFPLSADSAVVGDINQDGRIDTSEAIYALQVAAGLYPGVSTSCLLSGKGEWSTSTEYVDCDVVSFDGENYVCNTSHTSPTSVFGDDVATNWDLLSLKGDKGDPGVQGPQGIPGEDGAPGTSEWADDTDIVTTNSRVGISLGTYGPNESLEIGGDGRIFIGDGGGSDRTGLLIDANESGNYVRLNPYNYQLGSNMDLYISSNTGIGTSTPGEKLEITGNLRFSPGGNRQIQLPDGTFSLYIGGDSSVLAPWAVVNRGKNKVLFITEEIERMRIDNVGNVGIGTPTPAAKLEVAGGILIANDNSPCDTSKAGLVRWTGNVFQGCSGSRWITFSESVSDVTTVISVGQEWMDRNLGATRVATSPSDVLAFGDLYQWGRYSDGHESRTSMTLAIQSNYDVPGHAKFITGSSDWRDPHNNDLWQASGINNPCPYGFRLPTDLELDMEKQSWSSPGTDDTIEAHAAPLKFVLGGYRSWEGAIEQEGLEGRYWTSTTGSELSSLAVSMTLTAYAGMGGLSRGTGASVRCIKD